MNIRIDDYIETFTGKKFYFMNPDPDDIDIIDIAHSLAMQCRYTGHANRFYSIAEHSLIVSKLCKEENKFWALMHDASEAYLTDVASPIKQHLSNYKEIELNLMKAVCLKFGLPEDMPKNVHEMDVEALRSEANVMISSKGKDWYINRDNDTPIIPVEFNYYSHITGKEIFLEKFEELKTYHELKT